MIIIHLHKLEKSGVQELGSVDMKQTNGYGMHVLYEEASEAW